MADNNIVISQPTGLQTLNTRVLGTQVNETHEHRWDPISGRMHQTVNAGDYVHRVITGAVTNQAVGATVSLGNFTAGSRDEAFCDLEAFVGFDGNTTNGSVTGYFELNQAGTLIKHLFIDDRIGGAFASTEQGKYRRLHITSPSQHEPLFRIQAGTVCNINFIPLVATATATLHISFAGPRLAFSSASTAPVGIV